ncbi:MAG: hypothetical protein BGO23_13890 [Solirubrobacterales bacterium 67-14]|nr:MAG: hypothetical protein BGO23_13890 [Solirubrobacterales bacterium 67-14]
MEIRDEDDYLRAMSVARGNDFELYLEPATWLLPDESSWLIEGVLLTGPRLVLTDDPSVKGLTPETLGRAGVTCTYGLGEVPDRAAFLPSARPGEHPEVETEWRRQDESIGGTVVMITERLRGGEVVYLYPGHEIGAYLNLVFEFLEKAGLDREEILRLIHDRAPRPGQLAG